MVEIWSGQKMDLHISFVFKEENKKGVWLACSPGIQPEQILIGLGEQSDFDVQKARRAAAKAVKTAKNLQATTIVIAIDPIVSLLARKGLAAVAEGAGLACFEPYSWKSDWEPSLFKVYLAAEVVMLNTEGLLAEVASVVMATSFARQLVNEPANFLTPSAMAKKMTDEAEKHGIETDVLDEKQMKDLRMEALLTVGSSAKAPPRLIVLRYNGAPKSSDRIALVGKGVTADTGGYCLKPPASQKGIRGDMAGGAAVCATMLALAKNGIPINAVAVIPAAENRISSDSFIPGDVIGSMAGKSIEIGNTDAEGRLMLADAITYAIQKEKATRIVDVATLTGAVVAMFGFTTAGAFCNNEAFYGDFEKAYVLSGEQYWRLPTFAEYEKMIETPVADLSNVSNEGCGTITAALFLAVFNEGLPWIHLDIAGTAWVDTPKWEYQSKGATGAGVSTLYHLCCLLAKGE